MFEDWLSQTKELQEQYFGHNLPKQTIKDQVEWAKENHIAAMDELHEALGEISWKPWATAEFLNREAYIGEIVDALHFIGNMLAGVGCTDEELSDAYLEKMERNRARRAGEYTGLDKCVTCDRALDDITAHGGQFYRGEDGFAICNRCWERS